MRMYSDFKNPVEMSDSDEADELFEAIEHYEVPVVVGIDNELDFSISVDESDADSDSLNSYLYTSDSDYSDINDSEDNNEIINKKIDVKLLSGSISNDIANFNEDDEDDPTVRAIIAAIKKTRTSPPEIRIDEFISDICFHPEQDIIALATITGDVTLYGYSNEENKLLRNIEIHSKACRDVEFTDDGLTLLTCSKDKSIMLTDMESGKLKKFYESAHNETINKLYVLDENVFISGDDGGTVKMWDLRTSDSIFSLKEVEDYISQMLTNDSKKLLLVTSGDGYLTTINIAARKLFVQSEPYDQELTCMNIYRGDTKLIVGGSKGQLYSYNWGQFGYHCDMFPGIKSSITQMLPITDRIGCVAGEEGVIQACHIAPFRCLGVVGQHNMPIECLDINSSGELIASSSHNNDVRFWNVKYFEEFRDIKYNEKHNTFKDSRHNLPSSKFSNAGDFFADLKPPSDCEN